MSRVRITIDAEQLGSVEVVQDNLMSTDDDDGLLFMVDALLVKATAQARAALGIADAT